MNEGPDGAFTLLSSLYWVCLSREALVFIQDPENFRNP
jgi:hypothetical protein